MAVTSLFIDMAEGFPGGSDGKESACSVGDALMLLLEGECDPS